jgi:hypothetical protein
VSPRGVAFGGGFCPLPPVEGGLGPGGGPGGGAGGTPGGWFAGPVCVGGGCRFATAVIKGRLGNGLKSTINGWVRINSSRSMSTGIGRVVAPAGTSSICPPRTVRDSPGLLLRESRDVPSSVISLLPPTESVSKITVVPVIATVTALLLIDPPPEFFGTRNRIEPLSMFAVRPDLLKLKIVFAPSRVIVRSGNVSSERESPPVRTPVSSETLSFTAAS